MTPATDRDTIPGFIYGTAWKEDATEELVRTAIEAGFTGIDTANQRRHYVEAAVGTAVTDLLESGTVKREDLFLQTKFTYAGGQDHRIPYDPKAGYPDQVRQSFQSSLEHLGTDYLDSYVLHGPLTRFGLTREDMEVWETMESLHHEGRTKFLGVSNVSFEQLGTLIHNARIKPAFVQNRCFAQMGWDRQVRELCRRHDITYQGFSLLTANRFVLSDPGVQSMARRLGRTPQQLVFSFAMKVGMLPLTGTTSRRHMEQDLACLDLTLSEEDARFIDDIALGQ